MKITPADNGADNQQPPADFELRRELADRHEGLGDELRGKGDLEAAIGEYRESSWHRDGLAIAARLARRTEVKLECQLALAAIHEKIGEVQRQRGNLQEAMEAYQAARAYRISLAFHHRAADPDATATGWRGNLSAINRKIAQLHRA